MAEFTEEIFAVGTWNDLEFTIDDLNNMAEAFNALKDFNNVPLKLGHNKEQEITDGQPALGWLDDVFVKGEKLLAKFADVPELVAEAIKKKLYRSKSVELQMEVEHEGKTYPWVLSSVALLGSDIPAVKTLNDLRALMSRQTAALTFSKRVVFTTAQIESKKPRSKNMSESEEIKTLTAKVEAQSQQIEKLISTNTALEQKVIEDRVKFTQLEETDKHRKQLEERSLLETKLDAMVKEKKIAPFSRDKFLADYDQADDKQVVIFSVNSLEDTIKANPAYFGAEQARMQAEKTEQESDQTPDQIVVARAREYMVKNGEKNFSAAKTAVLQADVALANRYTKMEG